MAISENDVRRRLCLGYLDAAERDLKVAELIAQSSDRDLLAMAAYHVQQCAEKVAKAVFVARGVTVTKEHRLTENLDTLFKADAAEPWVSRLRGLEGYDRYATTARYPSTTGKLSAGPAPQELADDLIKVRSLLAQARHELANG